MTLWHCQVLSVCVHVGRDAALSVMMHPVLGVVQGFLTDRLLPSLSGCPVRFFCVFAGKIVCYNLNPVLFEESAAYLAIRLCLSSVRVRPVGDPSVEGDTAHWLAAAGR